MEFFNIIIEFSTNITYQGYVDSVNQISVDDVSGVDGDPKQLMPSDWKETDSSPGLHNLPCLSQSQEQPLLLL